jgi:DNA-directed RNA polymerase specialized sigma54-like protein
MISALQNGKISTQIIEDSLTSSVFDHLLLFPDDLFYRILKNSCYKNSLPETIGNIESYEYWPHWDATNTTRTSYIEPDLFLRFDGFDLIVEAKRWDYNQQYLTQWKNEFIGYKNEYNEAEKNVFLLAIGGINNEEEESINVENYGSINIIKCRWNRILEVLNELDQCYYINNNNFRRIALIIISALELHGYIKINWLDDLIDKYRIDYDNSLSALNNWREKDGWI